MADDFNEQKEIRDQLMRLDKDKKIVSDRIEENQKALQARKSFFQAVYDAAVLLEIKDESVLQFIKIFSEEKEPIYSFRQESSSYTPRLYSAVRSDEDRKAPEKQPPHCESFTKKQSMIPGLHYVGVPGDGHCLYHAVALYVDKTQEDLRQLVVNHLNSHREDLSKFSILLRGLTLDDYISRVRSGVEWADHIEIEILMRVFNQPIIVIEPNGSMRMGQDLHRFTGEPIFVLYNGHNHYDALIPTGELKARQILEYLCSQHPASHPSLV